VLATAPQGTLAMPPISGNEQLDVADFGPLQMRGIRIEAGPQVMPINASTTAAPATPSSSGH
jgi:hypothetical protein